MDDAISAGAGSATALAGADVPAPDLEVPEVLRPQDLKWSERRSDQARVGEVRPRRSEAIMPLLLAPPWNGIMVPVSVLMLLHGAPWSRLVLLLPHLLAGFWILHMGLTLLLNRARLTVDARGLRLSFGPVPQLGNLWHPLSDIHRFVVVQRRVESFLRKTAWTVAFVDRRNASTTLRLSLDDRLQAAFVAARLNQWLEELRTPAGYREPPV